ncbi:PilW family protein [Metallibacterium sp.]
MRRTPNHSLGFSLVELMVAIAIGLIVLAGIATVFMAQRQVVSSSSAQGAIQNADNAISAILSPAIRGAGFTGCGTLAQAVNSVTTPPPGISYSTWARPWVFSRGNFSAPVFGFDANGTDVGGSYAITALNAANVTNGGDWTPALTGNLARLAEQGSDVLVLNGEAPGTHPIGVPTVQQTTAPNQFTVYNAGTSSPGASPIQFTDANGNVLHVLVTAVAVSDCAKSSIFVPAMTSSTDITNPVAVAAIGSHGAGNVSQQIAPVYQDGVQLAPMQQVAYFVGQGHGGQSALYQAVLVQGQWSVQELIPGVDNMQVLYGVGLNGQITQYLSAKDVQALQATPPAGVTSLPFNPWTIVNSIRIGFLIEGGLGSVPADSNPKQWNVLGTTITLPNLPPPNSAVPNDTRLRHVYVMTINLRNTTL